MLLMPHPWVYSATFTGGKITLRVEVTDLQTTQGAIEITGEATQVGGAFAPIACIRDIATAEKGDPNEPDEADKYFMNVDAIPAPDNPFKQNQDVTVFVRVSKVWVTVLGPGTGPFQSSETDPRAGEGRTWAVHRADAHISERTGSY